MRNILTDIVAQKRLEINALYEKYDFEQLKRSVLEEVKITSNVPRFYQALSASRSQCTPFFISEFKRKSPSEGWINRQVDLPAQVLAYTQAGAGAISILTDATFFGGSYDDLALAAKTLREQTTTSPLLLQKDFVLDPIQMYLARQQGADIILLIAAILAPDQLEVLRLTAESIGLGVLVEVHDQRELEGIRHLDFPVLGINNRDLRTFRTALNRVNVLRQLAGDRMIIAESGLQSYRDFQIVRDADGFLIGTSLMRDWPAADQQQRFARHFQAEGRLLFKACGIRTPNLALYDAADFLGINFSPRSRRRPEPALLEELKNLTDFPAQLVAVFYQNTEDEIRQVLADYPFKTIQLYAHDVTPDFLRSLRQKVFLACALSSAADLERLEDFAADVDLFILDGAVPGSGQVVPFSIPYDFKYPFLLAGGLHAGNLEQVAFYRHCLGVDVASGIESEGQVAIAKILEISEKLTDLQTHS